MNLTEIADSLRILNQPSGGDQILEAVRKLDRILSAHRVDLEPRLVHFLERRSYQKALQFIEEEADPPKGECR